jgi:hypothetical protein
MCIILRRIVLRFAGFFRVVFPYLSSKTTLSDIESLNSAGVWADSTIASGSRHDNRQNNASIVQSAQISGTVLSDAPARQPDGNQQEAPDSLHVVFGVPGWGWTVALQGIGLSATPTDSDFFSCLKAGHQRHRYKILGWLSLFQFLNCRFVRVSDRREMGVFRLIIIRQCFNNTNI